MSDRVAICGAGIIGSLTAYQFQKRGHAVTLFDKRTQFRGSCSDVAGGLLDPIGTLEDSEPLIGQLGSESLPLWEEIVKDLGGVYFRKEGSLTVAHPHDIEQLTTFKNRIASTAPDAPIEEIQQKELFSLEPELDSRFEKALFFPFEGQIDNRALLPRLHQVLKERGGRLEFGNEVTDMHKLGDFDHSVDCRGLGAPLSTLRGVRGELIIVRAPEVNLSRPIRLEHPKQPIYVIPRPNHLYAIGATQIECEDYRDISVRSTMELLSGAFVIHSGFAEAEIVETLTQCRPAFSDNTPRLFEKDGIFHINGLFRHGYLISPKLTELAVDFILEKKKDANALPLYEAPK